MNRCLVGRLTLHLFEFPRVAAAMIPVAAMLFALVVPARTGIGQSSVALHLESMTELSAAEGDFSELGFSPSGRVFFKVTSRPIFPNGLRFISVAAPAEETEVDPSTVPSQVSVAMYGGFDYVGYLNSEGISQGLFIREINAVGDVAAPTRQLLTTETFSPVQDSSGFRYIRLFRDFVTDPMSEPRPRFAFIANQRLHPDIPNSPTNEAEAWTLRTALLSFDNPVDFPPPGHGHLMPLLPSWNSRLEDPIVSQKLLPHPFLPSGANLRQLAIVARVTLVGGQDLNSLGRDLVAVVVPPVHATYVDPQDAPVETLEYRVAQWGGTITAFGPDKTFCHEGPYFHVTQILEADATMRDTNATVSVLPGLGGGQFGSALSLDVGPSPRDLAVASINPGKDSHPDLLVLSSVQGVIQRFLGRLGSSAGPVLPTADMPLIDVPLVGNPEESTPFGLTIGNLDLDVRDEIVTANADENSITIVWNKGCAAASEAATQIVHLLAGQSKPVDVVIGDLDADGFNDLLVVNKASDDLTIALSGELPLTEARFDTGSALLRELDSTSGSRPVAARVGDMDNDGKIDIVLAQNGKISQPITSLGVGIHYGLANPDPATGLPFAGATNFSLFGGGTTNPEPIDLATADLDGDGSTDLDIVTANHATGDIRILKANPSNLRLYDPIFLPALAADLRGVAVGNFDPEDHRYWAEAPPDSPPDRRIWFTNDFPEGDAAPDPPETVRLDIAAISETEDMAFVLLNDSPRNGAISFQSTPRRFPVGDAPQAIVAVDLTNLPRLINGIPEPVVPDQPGILDLVVVNRDSNDVSILLGRAMDRALFDPSHRVAVGKSPRDVAVGKLKWFNPGDEIAKDIVTSNRTDATVTVLQGNGVPGIGGQFHLLSRRPSEYPAFEGSEAGLGQALALGNFGGPGAGSPPDIFVTSTGGRLLDLTQSHAAWRVYETQMDGQLASGAFGDLKDGSTVKRAIANRVISGQFGAPVPVYSRADRMPMSERTDVGVAVMPAPPNMSQADGTAVGQVSGVVALMSPVSLGVVQLLPVGFGASSLTAGDFVGNGFLSIAVACSHDHTISLLRHDGSGFLPSIAIPSGGFQPRDVVLSDLDGDGKLDLLVANTTSNSVTYLRGLAPGDPTNMSLFSSPIGIAYGPSVNAKMQTPIALLAEDLNADGRDDVVVANFRTASVSVFINGTTAPGNPVWSSVTTHDVGKAPARIAVGEVTADGTVDIVVANMLTAPSSPVTVDLFDHTTPGLISYSGNNRYIAWTAAVTADSFNASPPTEARVYRGALYILDRLQGSGPQRMFTSGEVVVDARFDEITSGLSRIAFIRRDPAFPKDKTKETLWKAHVIAQ